MTFAVLDDSGVVVNVIAWDATDELPQVLEASRLVAVEPDAQISVGWVFQNGVFSNPNPPPPLPVPPNAPSNP